MEPEQWEEFKPYALNALQVGTYTLSTENILHLVHSASRFVAFVGVLIHGDNIYKLFLDSLPNELLFLWQLSQ